MVVHWSAASPAATRKSSSCRPCWRQEATTVSSRSANRLPDSLSEPKLPLRHSTAGRSARSATRTGLDHVGLAVASRAELEGWQRHLAELGVSHSPIADRPYGSVLVFRDPDNIQLELFAPPDA